MGLCCFSESVRFIRFAGLYSEVLPFDENCKMASLIGLPPP